MDRAVDVVIRTAGARERASSLKRAILSVIHQEGVAARPIVVATGERARTSCDLALRYRARVHVVDAPVSAGHALSIGRGLVEAPWYAFLDDDDELLPHALRRRLDVLCADPSADLAVSNGYWVSGRRRRVHVPDIARHRDDPLAGIIERCWLASCGGVFRAASIGPAYFAALPDLCEWTWLAFRFALDGRGIRFLDAPSYNVHDTPGSLSKSDAFRESTLRLLAAMRKEALPAAARTKLERKYRAALHDAAEHHRREGRLREAWHCHLRSMKPPHTLRYGAYTRKLLWRRALPRVLATEPQS